MNTTILICLGAVLLIGVYYIIHKSAKQSKKFGKRNGLELPKQRKGVKDSDLSTTDIIKKFHYIIAIPHSETGLNREQRRYIKRHYKKFLWNWHLIPEKMQNVFEIGDFLAKRGNKDEGVNRFVVASYIFGPQKNEDLLNLWNKRKAAYNG